MRAFKQRLRSIPVLAVLALAVLPYAALAQSPSPESPREGMGPVNAECPAMPGEPFQAALFATSALVAAAGFFGGALVYGLDHYALP